MKITSEVTFEKFRIRFNDIIHMSINKKVEQVQVWKTDNSQYAIEVVTVCSSTVYEYDSEEKWKGVLEEMEKHNII